MQRKAMEAIYEWLLTLWLKRLFQPLMDALKSVAGIELEDFVNTLVSGMVKPFVDAFGASLEFGAKAEKAVGNLLPQGTQNPFTAVMDIYTRFYTFATFAFNQVSGGFSNMGKRPLKIGEILGDISRSIVSPSSSERIYLTAEYQNSGYCILVGNLLSGVQGLTDEELAKEIFFHAMVYYNSLDSDPLVNTYLLLNKNETWETFRERSNPVDLGGDGADRRAAFSYVWTLYA